MRKFFGDIMHRWLLTLLVSIWAFSLFVWKVNAPVHTAAVFIFLFCWTAVLCALDKLGKAPAVPAFLALTFSVTIALADRGEMGSYLSEMIWSGSPELSLSGDIVMLMMFGVLAVCGMYLFRSFWTRAVLCVGWIIFWVISAVMELDVPKLALSCMVPVILFTLVEGIHLARKRGTRAHFESIASALMSLFVAASLLLMIVPVSDEPYEYPLIRYIWNQMKELYDEFQIKKYYRTEGTEEFELSFSGYSDSAHTGEGLAGDSGGVLFAQPVVDTDGNLYLIGNTWDTFTGSGWASNVDSESEQLLEWSFDTAEHIYSFWRYQQNSDSISTDAFIRSNSIYFSHKGLNTRTLFSAANTLRIYTDTQRFPWQAQGGRILFDYVQDRDTYYRVYLLELNPELLPEVIAQSEGYEYDINNMLVWQRIYRSYFTKFQLTMDQYGRVERFLAQRQKLIYDTYMGIPADVSHRVRALAAEITAGCSSDYEKLMAIAAYLQTNFTYTTSPAPVPENVSFLDHMLFEAQEGYCSWFATAATVLARCEGIPARYVQGYCVPLKGGRFTSITSASSHAWCEGYIPGYGWVTVEATPGYSVYGTGWDQGDAGAGVASGEEEEVTVPEETQPSEQTEDLEAARHERNRRLAGIAGITIGAVAAVLLLAAAIRRIKAKLRYEAADYAEKAVMDLETAIKSTSRRNYARRPEESLRQYFARLEWSARIDTDLTRHMALLYEQILFGDRKLTKEEWQECRRFTDMLRKLR